MGVLKSSEEYCTYSYYGSLVTEYCTITDIYSNLFYDDVYTSYTTRSYYSPYESIISSDEYCTWSYGIFSDIETCSTVEYYMNGDIITYTDTYIH
jgi:hypothetical protein